jgi:hypothetical protein
MLEEIFGGGCTLGQTVMGQGELGILDDGLPQELTRVVTPKVLGQGSALDVLLFCFRR